MPVVISRYPRNGSVVGKGPVGCADGAANKDYRYLDVGLPLEIARLKAAGFLDRAVEACNRILAADPEPELAACVRVERHRMLQLPHEFCVTRTEAIERVRREWPEFSEKQFNELIAHRRIDWRYVDGKLCVLDGFIDSLRIYPKDAPGLAPDSKSDTSKRRAMLAEMHEQGGASRIITLRASISVPGAMTGERVRAWLPIPKPGSLQSHIEILDATAGAIVAPEDASARTIYWDSTATRSFSVTYRYRIDAPYTDTASGAFASARPVVGEPDPVPADTAEDRPHIAFTPYLRSLAHGITAGASSQLDAARAIYMYVTEHVDYRYQPAYAQLDSIADSCAHSLRGDCGVMALLFITLCRIAGIPARWESGLYVAPDHVGPHDWARFYIDGAGWLWADCSFGSSARREGDDMRRAHHFGNVDPWRMVANDTFQAELSPVCDGIRHDPYDNQTGEASVNGRGCRDNEMARTIELVEMQSAQYRA